MARIDTLLAKMDLRTLEALVAKRRRAEERKLTRLRARKRKLEKELRSLDQALARTAAAEKKRTTARAKTRRRPNARRLNDITLGDAIEKVLRGRKTPLHYKVLTQTIQKRGLYRTRSSNLLSTVAVTLKRDRRFRKVEPGYYTVRK